MICWTRWGWSGLILPGFWMNCWRLASSWRGDEFQIIFVHKISHSNVQPFAIVLLQ